MEYKYFRIKKNKLRFDVGGKKYIFTTGMKYEVRKYDQVVIAKLQKMKTGMNGVIINAVEFFNDVKKENIIKEGE